MANYTVEMGKGGLVVYDPAFLTISVGDTVTWVVVAMGPHNVVFDPKNIPDEARLDKINHKPLVFANGESVSSTFTVPGEYSYYSEPYRGAGMTGKIIVR